MYSGLYPGKVSTDYDSSSDLVPVEFDDGDTGVIKIAEIRLLAPNHPVRGKCFIVYFAVTLMVERIILS